MDAEQEYIEAKKAFLAAQERLAKAKAALPNHHEPSKADLARELAIKRDEQIAASYAAGVTSTKLLAQLHSVSATVVRAALYPIKHPEAASATMEWRARTLARISAARR